MLQWNNCYASNFVLLIVDLQDHQPKMFLMVSNSKAVLPALFADSPNPKGSKISLLHGDCLERLKDLPTGTIDLVMTSPPYANQRVNVYGGVHPDKYVEWFMPIGHELARVLKPDGSFILNIKERVVSGERHTYVIELILELKKAGWLWTEEYMWHKKNCYPGKWPNRFRDAWERCLHFTRQRNFAMYQREVMVPMGDWKESRLKVLNESDNHRAVSNVGSGFGKKISNWVGREFAYPTNVLHLATECGNKKHSAVFPESLPEWFIKLFTAPGDIVLDPFCGVGTTLKVAKKHNRDAVGIEQMQEYCEIIAQNLNLSAVSNDHGGCDYKCHEE